MSRIRLVLSCGDERRVDSLVWDAYGISEGDDGWCNEHPAATVVAMFVESSERRASRSHSGGRP